MPPRGKLLITKELNLTFSEAEIGKLKIKNRIVVAPMGLFYQDCLDGLELKPQVIEFYESLARGGAGMVIISASFYFPMIKEASITQPFAMWKDKYISPLSKLVEAVQKHGTFVGLHYTHMGSFAHSMMTGQQPISVSGNFKNPMTKETPREITKPEIKEVIRNLADAARRSKEAGFDFIEYNAYSGYLIREFLSSATNSRTDEYGGPLENRLRFFQEIIYATKEKVGDDYPIIAKISGDEFVPGGNTWKEAIGIAKAAESWGVDALHVSPGGHDTTIPLTLGYIPKGAFTYLARLVKEQVQVPVITAHVDDLFLAERVLSLRHADFIAFGRQFLADPEFPLKAEEGRFEDIRPCIRCNQECYDKVMSWQNVGCLMNPLTGRKPEGKDVSVTKRKKIMIAGCGPGGLKCAEELVKRGHHVSIYEKEGRLGGQLNPCSIPPGKAEFARAIEYFSNLLPKLGVEIFLNSEVTPSVVESEKPDVVIVATGASLAAPRIPGVEKEKVTTAIDALERKVHVGKRVVVIGGGGIGCDTALFLAMEGAMDAENALFLKEWGGLGEDFLDFTHMGKQVTILETLPSIGKDIGISRRSLVRRLLPMNNVEVITEAEATAITEKGVEFIKEGKKLEIEADTVVIASGTIPENKLYDELQGKVPEVYIIGDAQKPRKALDAIKEAVALAHKI